MIYDRDSALKNGQVHQSSYGQIYHSNLNIMIYMILFVCLFVCLFVFFFFLILKKQPSELLYIEGKHDSCPKICLYCTTALVFK